MSDHDHLVGGAAVTYDVSPSESLSEGVVAAVAAASDVDPVATGNTDPEQALDPLYTVVDPDALDALFRRDDGASTDGQVSFPYGGHHVTVDSDGRITVRERSPADGAR